jgi:hypothetical protein
MLNGQLAKRICDEDSVLTRRLLQIPGRLKLLRIIIVLLQYRLVCYIAARLSTSSNEGAGEDGSNTNPSDVQIHSLESRSTYPVSRELTVHLFY